MEHVHCIMNLPDKALHMYNCHMSLVSEPSKVADPLIKAPVIATRLMPKRDAITPMKKPSVSNNSSYYFTYRRRSKKKCMFTRLLPECECRQV